VITNLSDDKRKLTLDIERKKDEIEALNKKSERDSKALESCMREVEGMRRQN
jgi:hypothetical protein